MTMPAAVPDVAIPERISKNSTNRVGELLPAIRSVSSMGKEKGVEAPSITICDLVAIVVLLRMQRREKRLTLRDLETKMKVSHAYISKLERGLALPGMVVLMRWCKALDLQFVDAWRQASDEWSLAKQRHSEKSGWGRPQSKISDVF